MKKDEIVGQWSDALDSGSFLTRKHDPTNLSIEWGGFRTVLSPEAAASLNTYIKSGDYGIRAFDQPQPKYSGGSGFFEIVPSGSYPFSVPGSGVQSGSTVPSTSCDRLVVVWGQKQGWHIYAEHSAQISAKIASGELIPNCNL